VLIVVPIVGHGAAGAASDQVRDAAPAELFPAVTGLQ